MTVQVLPPSPMGSPPGSSFWNDWYEKLRTIVNSIAAGFDFSLITNKPTTLAGYGITDGQTKLTNSAGLAAALSDETGTGLSVFNNTPTLITPVLGAATGTSLSLGGGTTLTTTNQTGTGNLVLANTPTLVTPNIGAATGLSLSVANSGTVLIRTASSDGGGVNMDMTASGTDVRIGTPNGVPFLFRISGVTVGNWDTSGNLGIGSTPSGTYKLEVNGALSIASNTLIRTSVAFTNGAAAAAGTLANAPVAGNPTKWVPINDNGTIRYLPAW